MTYSLSLRSGRERVEPCFRGAEQNSGFSGNHGWVFDFWRSTFLWWFSVGR
jgi:hypothetical protein